MTASGPGQTPESPAGGSQALLTALRSILGSRHVLTGARRTERYRKGFRSGEGEALAVAFPGSLLDYWRVLKAAVEADAIIIFQAANTGLTEGSSPKGSYDRPVLIINTLRLDKIHLLRNGEQALALPGATLFALTRLLKPLGREPHSVIGSSSIGATVVGGICNNSGGALTKRGPAYTEMALYARRTADGALRLVNHLGLALGDTPEEILGALDRGELGAEQAAAAELHCSDPTYDARVRDVDADSPARYNANPTLLRETAGCAGKLAVFAVRVDTFPADVDPKLFYIGSETTETLTTLRRR
ncbi:MAG: D-lactate dehydrogenase, partial [Pseudomonadota bacterium]